MTNKATEVFGLAEFLRDNDWPREVVVMGIIDDVQTRMRELGISETAD